ncbi:MAG TPA: hydantoinase B/oxoprolinase family protein [Methylomirabilota bacterium]|nr:hydantoinase B/oxoprolinase family protein [Methylomirabilota bacterium]
MTATRRPLDPVTTSILWARLLAVVDEAAATLIRTSFSTIVREVHDMTQLLTDDRGQTLAQSAVSTPGFVGTTAGGVRRFLELYGRRWRPGDVAITNDPWVVTGHLPDVTVVSPVFHRSRLVAFMANTAHMTDIGGTYFGVNTTEVFEEGLRIPPVRLVTAGRPVEPVWAMIRANVRAPDQVIGDIRAQVAANAQGQRAISAIMADYGLTDLRGLARAIHDASDRALGAALAEVPDGIYHAEATGDGYGEPFTVKLALGVRRGHLHFDFTGSSPQQRTPINAVLQYTRAYAAFTTKCAFVPAIPNNEGLLRRIALTAPPGTIVNAAEPAPVQSRHVLGFVLQGAVFAALAQCAPAHCQADSGTPPPILTFYGSRPDGTPFVTFEFVNGGVGGKLAGDGRSTTTFPSNIANLPIEVLESIAPVLYLEQRLIPDSAGVGMHRGGLGQRKTFRVEHPMMASLILDRFRHPPPGVLGGGAGRRADARFADGRAVTMKSVLGLQPGDVLTLESAGGGGYGDPGKRPDDLVRRDLEEGYVTHWPGWDGGKGK